MLARLGALLGRPKFRYTIEELQELHSTLLRNPVVTEANRATVVETLRSVAEFIVWGDQNDPRLFGYLVEHNVLAYLQHLLRQPAHRGGEVARQVLQTLSITLQSVTTAAGLQLLLVNGYLNSIIELPFDFEDDEVLGYYITFLKAAALKLSPQTARFFISGPPGREACPLYTQAIRLAGHREGMVRAAVRTITLCVYACGHRPLSAFAGRQPAAGYFAEVAGYLAGQLGTLDGALATAAAAQPAPPAVALAALDSCLTEVDDVLEYCSDVLTSGNARLHA